MSNDLPGYARAQAEWEAMTPPKDGPCECPDCKGGYRYTTDDAENEHEIKCETCNGFGMLLDGEPFDQHAAEREACEADDRKRDESLTGEAL